MAASNILAVWLIIAALVRWAAAGVRGGARWSRVILLMRVRASAAWPVVAYTAGCAAGYGDGASWAPGPSVVQVTHQIGLPTFHGPPQSAAALSQNTYLLRYFLNTSSPLSTKPVCPCQHVQHQPVEPHPRHRARLDPFLDVVCLILQRADAHRPVRAGPSVLGWARASVAPQLHSMRERTGAWTAATKPWPSRAARRRTRGQPPRRQRRPS